MWPAPTSDCDTVDFIKNRSPSLRHADIASKNFKPFDCVNWRGSDFCFRTDCDLGDFLLQCCRQQGFEPCITYRCARENWVQAMVSAGFGITVMPEFSHTNVATVARPLVDPDLVRELSLVTVAGRRHEAALSCLLRAAREDRRQAKELRAPRSLITFQKSTASRIESSA
jgi:hypothetical protein